MNECIHTSTSSQLGGNKSGGRSLQELLQTAEECFTVTNMQVGGKHGAIGLTLPNKDSYGV